MNLKELIFKTRSYRRFEESYQIDTKTIESLIDLARLSPSGANKQPLKYLYYNTTKDCGKIFPYLAWAGYLTDWAGPDKGERPTAYIIILGDKLISDIFGVDHGIAAHSILLGATEPDWEDVSLDPLNEMNSVTNYLFLTILKYF